MGIPYVSVTLVSKTYISSSARAKFARDITYAVVVAFSTPILTIVQTVI